MAKNEAKIKFTAETGSFNSDIQKANSEMSELRAELRLNEAQMQNTGNAVEGLENKHSILAKQLKAAHDKTEALSQKVEKAAEIFGENSQEASSLRTQLYNAQTAEEKLRQAVSKCANELEEQRSAANQADNAIDGAGDAAKESADGFTIAKGAIADLVSEAIQFAIGKLSEFIGYLRELPEATREIRQDMATLETSYESAGFTVDQATNLWKDLYTVFGEDDRAVEAANLIAKMANNQQDLNDWVTIATGIFGTYQDSLPVEGLAEASNETAKTGKVTGVLADALNWSSEAATMFAKYMGDDVTTAEDAFNVALSECTTEEERQALITETLTALYGDAAAKYEEASGSQLAAKEATAENTIAQNNLANAIEPVTTAWQELKTQGLEAITPAISAVSGVMAGVFNWLKEHPAVLTAVTVAIGVLAAALGGLAIAWGVYTVAQWAANAAILANPITWIIMGVIAAIAAVIVAIGFVVEYWDEIVSACSSAWESVKATLAQWGAWISANVIQPVAQFFVGLWDGITNACSAAWNFICNVVGVAVLLVASIITAAIDIITLPFQFIWENCKQYVFAAWDWIQSKVSTAINTVSNIISAVWSVVSGVFSTVWNGIKNVVGSAWDWITSKVSSAVNSVKSAVSTAWNAVKSTVSNVVDGVKNKVSSVWDSIKSTTSNVFNGVKSTVSSVWNSIKSSISDTINGAKDTVKAAIDKIKGFFNFSWSLPKLKLPRISITGSFSLNPPSVPKFGISWFKDGGIMMNPTIFGINGTKLMAGGEAGPEAILPIDRLEGYISDAVEKSMNVVNLQSLADAIEDLANRPVQMNINGRQFAYATASDTDSISGMRSTFKSRGLAVD